MLSSPGILTTAPLTPIVQELSKHAGLQALENAALLDVYSNLV
jgi:hypothetical protein